MTAQEIFEQIKKKQSYLCIGLDTDYHKIPKLLLDYEYPVFEFNKRIIDSTADYAIAYKPNLAFYENMGAAGYANLELTIDYLRKKYPEIFLIADAKRGDIGNTSNMYASAYFKNLDFDAITVTPYMGSDSVLPFLSYENKWVILLALTSNEGSNNFQLTKIDGENRMLFEKVLSVSNMWGNTDNLMYVIGATRAEMLQRVRATVPDHFLLIPGVGAQGGSLEEVTRYGINKQCGLIVNSSRNIIYADCTDRFDKVARDKAQQLQIEMASYLKKYNLLDS